jgi:RNase adaptor protein for sRNA GlmZ degradation
MTINEKALTVRIISFSLKKGLPEDPTGNGGGYIFDCRAIQNPGVLDEYKPLTGMQQPVIDYLEKQSGTAFFKEHVFALIEQSVNRYIEREFTDLMVCFGCTGGQHRSVYFAEQMAAHLQKKFPVHIKLEHREQRVDKVIC